MGAVAVGPSPTAAGRRPTVVVGRARTDLRGAARVVPANATTAAAVRRGDLANPPEVVAGRRGARASRRAGGRANPPVGAAHQVLDHANPPVVAVRANPAAGAAHWVHTVPEAVRTVVAPQPPRLDPAPRGPRPHRR